MADKAKLERGANVAIYEDPYTREVFEGRATLMRCLRVYADGLERWRVHFDADPLEAEVERMILPREPGWTAVRRG